MNQDQIALETIRFFSVMQAGLMHIFNPASLLAWILFLCVFIVVASWHPCALVFAIGFIAFFSSTQFFVHLGVFDIQLARAECLLFWDIARMITALGIMILGGVLSCVWLRGKAEDSRLFGYVCRVCSGSCAVYLNQRKAFLHVALFFMLGSVFGIFLGFLNGTWPLHDVMLYLFYKNSLRLEKSFLLKVFAFELINVLPVFFVLLGGHQMLCRSIAVDRKRMVRIVGMFAVVCAAVGAAVVALYIVWLV